MMEPDREVRRLSLSRAYTVLLLNVLAVDAPNGTAGLQPFVPTNRHMEIVVTARFWPIYKHGDLLLGLTTLPMAPTMSFGDFLLPFVHNEYTSTNIAANFGEGPSRHAP